MLRRISTILTFLAVLFVTTTASAQVRNKKTTLTFSQPVEVPGIVLSAGTYVFKLADLQHSRNFVLVYNAEENKLLGTIMAIPHEHAVAHDKTYIGFAERPAGSPEAIHEWFYPGDAKGLEFVYPKNRAQQLAREAGQPVLAAEMKGNEPQAELAQEKVVEITPENREIEIAQTFDLPSQARVPAVPYESASLKSGPEMPKTASPVPLVALAGLVSLLVAGVMRAVVRKTN